MEYEEKVKRAKRRADTRRKNERDTLPKLHRDYKEAKKNLKDDYNEDIDGKVSR